MILRAAAECDVEVVLIGLSSEEVLTTCTIVIVPNLSRGGRPYAVIENVVTHPAHR